MLPDAYSKEGSGASWSKHSPTRCNESPETFTLYAVKAKIGLDNKKKKSNTYVKTRVCKFTILNQTILI